MDKPSYNTFVQQITFSCIRYVRLNRQYDFKVVVAKEIATGSIGLGGLQVIIIYYVVVREDVTYTH